MLSGRAVSTILGCAGAVAVAGAAAMAAARPLGRDAVGAPGMPTGGPEAALSAPPADRTDAPPRRPPYAGTAGAPQVFGIDRCPPYRSYAPVEDVYRSFYFTRGAYSSDPYSYRGDSWATDYEKADRQFLVVVERVLPIDAYSCENPIRLDDPWLRRFPFLYMVEVGYMGMTPPEVEGLRSYLLQGGFLLVDDFWGTAEWLNFEREMSKVFPERPIVELPPDHLVFRIVYPVDEVLQVPSVGNARAGQYWERDGYVPHMRGIFDDDGRLMVAIAWNSDLGDAWEWAEQPDYPWDRSNYALQMGMNFILYAMTH
jgi:hypothetical protein